MEITTQQGEAPVQAAAQSLAANTSNPSPEAKQTDVQATDGQQNPATENSEDANKAKPEKTQDWSQKRVDRMRAKLGEEQRLREAAERKIAEYRQKYEAQPNDGQPVEPREDQFNDYDKYQQAQRQYLKDLGKWEAKKEFEQSQAEEAQKRQQAEYRQTIEKSRQDYVQKESEFRKSAPDYDEALGTFNEYVELADKSDPRFHAFRDAFMVAEDKVALTYHLGKNPQVVESFFTMTPTQIMRAVARIEVELANAPKPHNQTTKGELPEPIKPVTGKYSPQSENGMTGRELRKKYGFTK